MEKDSCAGGCGDSHPCGQLPCGLRKRRIGRAAPADYERMTALVCDILQQEAGIPPAQTYVTYHPVEDWGWNGANF